jgi:hypothetical protein
MVRARDNWILFDLRHSLATGSKHRYQRKGDFRSLTFISYNARNPISSRLSFRKPEDLCSHPPFQWVFDMRQFLKSAEKTEPHAIIGS